MTVERRFSSKVAAPIGIETRDDGTRVITGYAAVFYRENDPGTEYQLFRDVVERISPEAFDRALDESDDARALFNHDMNNLLGRVSSDTLTLSADDTGLRYEIPVDEDDPDHIRVVRKIERGDLTGSSFSFIAEKATWIEEEERDIRQIDSVKLYDVGPVTFPAYESTTTALRAEGDAESAKAEYETLTRERELQRNRIGVVKQMRMIELQQAQS